MLVSTLRQRVCDRIGEAERAMAKAHGGIALGEDEFAFFEMASRGRYVITHISFLVSVLKEVAFLFPTQSRFLAQTPL